MMDQIHTQSELPVVGCQRVPEFGNFHKWLTSLTRTELRRFQIYHRNLADLPTRTLPPLNSNKIRRSKSVSKTTSLDPYWIW